MRQKKFYYLSSAIRLLLIISLSFPASVFSQSDIRININLIMRNSSGEVITTIPKGSILRIPEEYIKKNEQGEFLENDTLNSWIQDSSKQFHIKGRKENFFPIQVISSSNKSLIGHQAYVGLGYLARHKKSFIFDLKAQEDVIAVNSDPTVLLTNTLDQRKRKEATEAGVCNGCDKAIIEKGIPELQKTLKEVIDETRKKGNEFIAEKSTPNRFPPDNVISKFNSTCGEKLGIDFNDFLSFLKSESEKNNIPYDFMLAIITQESMGDCFALGDKKNKHGKSLGLFQIHQPTGRSMIKVGNACTESEIQSMKGKSLEELKQAPRCLTNPAVNLEASLATLKYYYKDYFKKELDLSRKKSWIDLNIEQRDELRILLSMYNGGNGYPIQARDDLRAYAKNYGIELNPNNWASLRLFHYRHTLEANVGKENLSKRDDVRPEAVTIKSIAYVESILGYNKSESFISTWSEHFQKQKELISSR